MTERIAVQGIPAEMAEPCFTQSQTSVYSTDQCGGHCAEIRFMAHQKTTTMHRSQQRPRISPRSERGLDLHSRGQAGMNNQLSSLHCPPVRTAQQLVGLVAQIHEPASHRKRALHSELRQRAIRMVLPMLPFSSDAMTEQEEINRD